MGFFIRSAFFYGSLILFLACIYTDVNFEGADLMANVSNIGNPKLCHSRCKNEERCKFWSFDIDRKLCHLKEEANLKEKINFVSGPKDYKYCIGESLKQIFTLRLIILNFLHLLSIYKYRHPCQIFFLFYKKFPRCYKRLLYCMNFFLLICTSFESLILIDARGSLDSTEILDLDNRRAGWRTGPKLPKSVAFSSISMINGRLILTGGRHTKRFDNSKEDLDQILLFTEDEWIVLDQKLSAGRFGHQSIFNPGLSCN